MFRAPLTIGQLSHTASPTQGHITSLRFSGAATTLRGPAPASPVSLLSPLPPSSGSPHSSRGIPERSPSIHACMPSCLSHVLFVTPWTVAHQAPLSMGFSRQEYWRGLPCPPPGDLPNLGTEPVSLLSPESSGRFFTTKRHPSNFLPIKFGLKFQFLIRARKASGMQACPDHPLICVHLHQGGPTFQPHWPFCRGLGTCILPCL